MFLSSSAHYTVVSVYLLLPLGVYFFLYLCVSVRLCVSIYVGLSRRTQCDRELGAVLVKEDISKLQLSPSGTSGYLVCMSLHT